MSTSTVEEQAGQIVTSEQPQIEQARREITILVADDEPLSRKMLATLLKYNGFSVIEAKDGQEALARAIEYNPDLILLDCQMPVFDGFEVCRRLNQEKNDDASPVIFVTGMNETDDKVKGFEVGGVDYITKPIEPVELLARVNIHLELWEMRKQQRKRADLFEEVANSQMIRLEQVKDGQESLLSDPDDFPELNVAVRFEPAAEAGGDFYDIIKLSDNKFGLFIADIAGHDLGVAYLTGALKAIVASFASEEISIVDTMSLANKTLCKLLSVEKYVTACYVKFSVPDYTIEIANAGHPPAIIRRSDGTIEFVDLVGDILGMYPHVKCQTDTKKLNSGDRLFLYTDGLIEGFTDVDGKASSWSFGKKEIEKLLHEYGNLSLRECINKVIDVLLDKSIGSIRDDILLMGIECGGINYGRSTETQRF